MTESRRVVVSGLGMVSALGPDAASTWAGVRLGRSAVRRMSFAGSRPFLGAPVELSDGAEQAASADPVVRLGLSAATEAVRDSAVDLSDFDPSRLACNLSTSKGGLRTLFAEHERFLLSGSPGADFFQRVHPGALAAAVSARFGFRGPCLSSVAACATGVHALIQAADLIRRGDADLVLTGAADASFVLPLLWSYARMGVLSKCLDDPPGAVKPFDRDRDGFAVGEGAAAFVLEGLESARARGAPIYGELAGWSWGADAYHLTSLAAADSQIAPLLGQALRRAELDGRDLGYLNAHGTATRQNDVLETRAIRLALGPAADGVPVSSTKPATGHLLGAAGAVETALTLLALRDDFVPPTLNLRHPDPECNLDYVPLVGRSRVLRTAACVSAGFGGQIGVLVFRKLKDAP